VLFTPSTPASRVTTVRRLSGTRFLWLSLRFADVVNRSVTVTRPGANGIARPVPTWLLPALAADAHRPIRLAVTEADRMKGAERSHP
jgi:hypothetical protein